MLALKACLRLVAEREDKETISIRYYEVHVHVHVLLLNLFICEGIHVL